MKKRILSFFLMLTLILSTTVNIAATESTSDGLRMASITFTDSAGNPIEGARVQYIDSYWHEAGTTDKQGNAYAYVEKQFNEIAFRVHYTGAMYDIKQNIVNNPAIEVSTVPVTIQLIDSKGQAVDGGSLQYCYSSWSWMDHMQNGILETELLPAAYTFRMHYQDGVQDIKQNIEANPNIVFQTIDTKVRLESSSAEPLEGGKVQYVRATWGDYGVTESNGEVHKELLPGTYTFRMKFRDGVEDIKQNISDDSSVIFKTLPVSVYVKDSEGKHLSDKRITYSRVQWSELGYTNEQGVYVTELLSGNYNFRSYYEDYYVNVGQDIAINQEVSIELPIVHNEEDNNGTNGNGEGGTPVDPVDPPVDPVDPVEPPVDPINNDPQTIIVNNLEELMATEILTKDGNVTVLIADGEYNISRTLWLSGDNLTYKSLSGNRDGVILNGNFNTGNVISVAGKNFTLQDVSICHANNHGVQVHGELDADYATIRNVHFYDIREQMIKGSGSATAENSSSKPFNDGGVVEDCIFEFTSGEAYQYYTAGIDIHHGRNWTVRNNTFINIKRKTGELTEGAIHFWSESEGTLIEGNKIINCDRGIMLGLDYSNDYGSTIRNNFIYTTRDVGIYLCQTKDALVYNNTLYSESSYDNDLEYRFDTSGTEIKNNITSKPIMGRNNAIADVENNVTNATSDWFKNASNGDLHLSKNIQAVVNKGIELPGIKFDIDGEERLVNKVDIGADEVKVHDTSVVKSINLTSDKTVIRANGSDTATYTLIAIYEDGSEEVIASDYMKMTNNDISREINGTQISSYEPGTYEVKAYSGKLESNKLPLIVEEIGSQNYVPTDVEVYHAKGQTFITFTETQPLLVKENAVFGDFVYARDHNPNTVEYNIYRSDMPISSVDGLEKIATVKAGSAYNIGFYNMGYNDPEWKISSFNTNPLPRFVIKDGEAPLRGDQGIFVTHPSKEGQSYYAVTAVVNNVEINTILNNTTKTPVIETVGQGEPVLQYSETKTFDYISNAELSYYVRWEGPPHSSIDGVPFTYLVGTPPKKVDKAPVGIHLHCWGGNMTSGYGWWNDAEEGAIILASNQSPYDWWTGYHENYYDPNKPSTQAEWEAGVVHPYTSDRMISFLEWMNESDTYNLDMSRTFVAGTSMGGSGALMMAIRYPEYFSWCRSWVGVHIPELSPSFKSSYASAYGSSDYNVLFEDGTPVWDYYNDDWYLRNHQDTDIGFLTYSNGKNDSEIGWNQAVMFENALKDTKQPHMFVWGQNAHSERAKMPMTLGERIMEIDIRLDQALPAFTNCSLDDDYGNGDVNDGVPSGQVNAYLYWLTDNIVDNSDRFEMTVCLTDKAPENSCTVAITPRRLQSFSVKSGDVVKYQNIDVATGSVVSEGSVVVDEFGLMTFENQLVTKSNNRIIITK